MTDQEKNEQTEPEVVVTPDELSQSMVSGLPALSQIRTHVDLMAALLSHESMGFPLEMTLQVLASPPYEADIDQIKKAIRSVLVVSDSLEQRLIREIAQITGRIATAETDEASEFFEYAADDELAEQAAAKQPVVQMQARLDAIFDFLDGLIVDLSAVEEEVVETPSIRDRFLSILSVIPGAVEEVVETPEVDVVIPDWSTVSIWDEENPTIKTIMAQVHAIEIYMAQLKDPEKVFKLLTGGAWTKESLEQFLFDLRTLLQQQTSQSEAIEQLVESQRPEFMARSANIDTIQALAARATNYLG